MIRKFLWGAFTGLVFSVLCLWAAVKSVAAALCPKQPLQQNNYEEGSH